MKHCLWFGRLERPEAFTPHKIFRCEGGPNKSTMTGYVNYGDDKTYLCNFRMTPVQLEYSTDKITKADFLKDSMHSAHSLSLSWRFKFPTCCYVLVFWGSVGNYFKFTTDVAGLGQTTVETWMYEFTKGKCWSSTICTTCHLQYDTYRRFCFRSEARVPQHRPNC
jgi:hypothetical protein